MFITVKSYRLLQLPIFQQLTSTRKDIFDITIFFALFNSTKIAELFREAPENKPERFNGNFVLSHFTIVFVLFM